MSLEIFGKKARESSEKLGIIHNAQSNFFYYNESLYSPTQEY